MKTTITVTLPMPNVIAAEDMKVGQFGILKAQGSDYDGEVVVRTTNLVANLNNPARSFDPLIIYHRVEIIPAGATFIVTVGDDVYPSLSQLDGSQREQIMSLSRQGHKINAIKEVRTLCNVGLKEAKEFVDNLF